MLQSITFEHLETRKPLIFIIKINGFYLFGGERGIRTLDTGLPYTRFPGVLLQPLGHLTVRRAILIDQAEFGKDFCNKHS